MTKVSRKKNDPKLLPRVLEALSDLKHGSTLKKITDQVHAAIRLSKVRPRPRNVLGQVRRALKHGVQTGLLRHRAGRFRLATAKEINQVLKFGYVTGRRRGGTAMRRKRGSRKRKRTRSKRSTNVTKSAESIAKEFEGNLTEPDENEKQLAEEVPDQQQIESDVEKLPIENKSEDNIVMAKRRRRSSKKKGVVKRRRRRRRRRPANTTMNLKNMPEFDTDCVDIKEKPRLRKRRNILSKPVNSGTSLYK